MFHYKRLTKDNKEELFKNKLLSESLEPPSEHFYCALIFRNCLREIH